MAGLRNDGETSELRCLIVQDFQELVCSMQGFRAR